jgi:hypothetical protein
MAIIVFICFEAAASFFGGCAHFRRLTMASGTQESLWNLMEVAASLCSLVEASWKPRL